LKRIEYKKINGKEGEQSVKRISVIQESLKAVKGKTYIEIGVAAGDTFCQVQVDFKIGVDPQKPISRLVETFSDNVIYYRKMSDNFFATEAGILESRGLDVAFIDGLHTYQQSLRDVENCLRYLKKTGVIVMHDCNPNSLATMQPNSCGDVWRTIVHLRSIRRDLKVFVLDCDCGLGVVTYGTPENQLAYTPEVIQAMTFDDLDTNRESFLNIKQPAYFDSFVKSITVEE
jgi:hypothetical protein